VVISISGDSKTLETISYASRNIEEVFGIKHKTFTNLNAILTRPVAGLHHLLLQDSSFTGGILNKRTLRKVFLKTPSGYMV
jgi:hypothetical protein